MSCRETIIRQKNWRERLETAPTWRQIGRIAGKACGFTFALVGWCWLASVMPALIQFFMMVPVAVLILMAVVYGIPLAVFALALLMWAISRDVMRLYDRCKGPVVGETHLTRASS
jgi:hypothetical protein